MTQTTGKDGNETNSAPQNNPTSVRKLLKTIAKIITAVLLPILVLLWWIGLNPGLLETKISEWKSKRYEQALQQYLDEQEEMYSKDTDGGKTPEETIDLFITALKQGDVGKASRYYVLEKQQSIIDDLKDEIIKYGDLRLSIEYFTEVKNKGTKGCNKEGHGCIFEYEYIREKTSTTTAFISGQNLIFVSLAGSNGTKLIDTNLNKLTNVWKITLP